jgi:hypothetical protein
MTGARRHVMAGKAELPAAVRERLIVIDDFLPAELAEAMRGDIDMHFRNPERHAPASHQVWNYWFVPELYAYLRTQPEKVIAPASASAFHERLSAWSINNLGLGRVSWPYLSLYVAGCRQGLHNDAVNGRFAFVYSLTRDARRTQGGRTIVHREGDPARALMTQASAGRSFFDAVEPRFNRLVVFDDRLPHAVEPLEGSMDPLEGRFVLHGHLGESGPIVGGALAPDTVVAPLAAALEGFAASTFLDGYHGPLTLRLDIRPQGDVASCRVMLDRVLHPDPGDGRWPWLLGDLVARLAALTFPAAAASSIIVAPVVFGAQLPRG